MINLKILFLNLILLITFILPTISESQVPETMQSVLFLIDCSGSMNGQKIDSVKSATKRIIKILWPCNTEFAIMGFSGEKKDPINFRLSFTTKLNDLLPFVDSLKAEGGTPLGAAFKTASFYFKNNKNPKSTKQTIILLTDGRSDDNIAQALNELKERNSLIHSECIGFDIVNDKQAELQLRQIAHETGGEYYDATNVSNVIMAFLKPGIKTIIRDVPVEVRENNGRLNFQLRQTGVYRMLTNQYWIVDSIQINVSSDLFDLAQMITSENMQDTLPKSIVFDNNRNISLFVSNGSHEDSTKKWLEGTYQFFDNTLSITLKEHYLKLVIKQIERQSLVLCVNRYRNLIDDMSDIPQEICDCNNKMDPKKPYILVYFSQGGCEK